MKAEIITIGDELLIGQVIDRNSAWIAEFMKDYGIQIIRITSVSDNKDEIYKALVQAESNVDIIFTTGGLGPTKDDITKNVICNYFNTQLGFDEIIYNDIVEFFKIRNRTITEINKEQAFVPKGCIPLRNKYGTAPGIWIEKGKKTFIILPGVPYEMKYIIENKVIKRIIKRYSLPVFLHKTFYLIGIAESDLADKLTSFEEQLPDKIKLAYLPSPGYIRLRLSCISNSKNNINEFNTQLNSLKLVISTYIFSENNKSLPEVIGTILKSNKLTLSTAESCTGGKIASSITLVPGSSNYFKGSIVAYSNKIKESLLNVKKETLKTYGAVSEEVVKEMVIGVLNKTKTDYAISISGIAGPTGGTKDKPVGTVWIAVGNNKIIVAKRFNLGENRELNIEKAALNGLNLLRIELIKDGYSYCE